MNQTRAYFAIRDSLRVVSGFASRFLTPISIAVMIAGLVLVGLGPVRAFFASSAQPSTGGASAPAALMPDTAGFSPVDLIERQFVPFTTIPDRPRRSVIGYTIKPGDTLFGIAAEFGLKPETLFWSNKEILHDDVHLLLPGVTLVVLPSDGVYATADGEKTLDKIVADNNGDLAAVLASPYNELTGYTGADVPPWGMKIVIPGGSRELVSWPAPITIVTVTNHTTGVTTTVSGFMQGMGGSCAVGIPGGGGTTAWTLPVQPGEYTVTTPFAPWHSGIDMAGVLGTTVTAADTGVVVFSGWNDWGYGNLVVLDHGNGWTTYYAHLNSRVVGCGDTVQRGSPIGSIGTTGHSTGPHLHFEMRWLNTPTNPALYLGF
jgi:murein DD-endopeptidase MepM/ murein hydrolase activator NlpD